MCLNPYGVPRSEKSRMTWQKRQRRLGRFDWLLPGTKIQGLNPSSPKTDWNTRQ